jgi:hypothetical protein
MMLPPLGFPAVNVAYSESEALHTYAYLSLKYSLLQHLNFLFILSFVCSFHAHY